MPVIKPVSDLRNYSNVLRDMEDYEKREAGIRLFSELLKGRKAGEEQGWKDIEEVEVERDCF